MNLKVSERGRQQISFNGGLVRHRRIVLRTRVFDQQPAGSRRNSFAQHVGGQSAEIRAVLFYRALHQKPADYSRLFAVWLHAEVFWRGNVPFAESRRAAGPVRLADRFLQCQRREPFHAHFIRRLAFRQCAAFRVLSQATLHAVFPRRRFLSVFNFKRKGSGSQQGSTCGIRQHYSLDNPQFIPVIYCQPNIITSRVTLSFAYDTRNASVDPTSGPRDFRFSSRWPAWAVMFVLISRRFLTRSFFPMRRKKSDHPEVFGFRIIAGTVGSFATISQGKELKFAGVR